MTKKNYTIKDIAKMAGVSKGTVDRVLHKRGKVSESADAKVKRVLNEIDFQPNPIARNLKKEQNLPGFCINARLANRSLLATCRTGY